MIYIISEYDESATDDVIAWCKAMQIEVVRINYEDMPLSDLTIEITSFDANTNIWYKRTSKKIYQNDVVWYRRGAIKFKYPISNQNFSNYCIEFFKEEEFLVEDNFYCIPFSISNYHIDSLNNKLNNLLLAKEFGLNIPSTIVTSRKNDAITFLQKHGFCISKPLHNGHLNGKIVGDLSIASKGTFTVKIEALESLDTTFVPMLLQQYIPKQFEIRVFYFVGQFYAMAIFSQNDEMTQIDYRNYNREKPNRAVPFQLPEYIEKALRALIAKTELKTCSIDLIYTPNNEYYFLEINPNGQFGWVSDNCNFYIEKEIAHKLNELHDAQQ